MSTPNIVPAFPTKGMRALVFQDPITCLRPEGEAVVTKVLRAEDWCDEGGHPIYRCNVRFPGDSRSFERDVSRPAA